MKNFNTEMVIQALRTSMSYIPKEEDLSDVTCDDFNSIAKEDVALVKSTFTNSDDFER